MGGWAFPTIGHCDSAGYTWCTVCAPLVARPIVFDVAGNNCAFDDADCEGCGVRLPFDRSSSTMVEATKVVRLAPEVSR